MKKVRIYKVNIKSQLQQLHKKMGENKRKNDER